MCGPHLFDLWLFLDPEVAGVRELVVVDWMGRSVETDASVDVVHEIRISEDETDQVFILKTYTSVNKTSAKLALVRVSIRVQWLLGSLDSGLVVI